MFLRLQGLTISYSTLGAHSGSYSKDDSTKSNNNDENKEIDIIDTKFNCEDFTAWHYENHYKCETTHGSINGETHMEKVKASNITYLLGKKVKNEVLVEAVMASVLGNTTSTNWTRSTKSEKELEICMVQESEECTEIYAAVIITDIRDMTKDHNRFAVNYKIRMNKYHGRTDFHTDTMFFDNIGPYYIFRVLGILIEFSSQKINKILDSFKRII